MKINHSEYSIAELVDRYKKKELTINREYQRGSDIWPDTAKYYFIDTILEGYPFSKLYFYQLFDRHRRMPLDEVVDGQQRLLTIIEFMEDRIKLGKASKNFDGKKFSDLDEDTQENFVTTRVQVDVILSAQRPELLDMFRRMNAYTAPLNEAEKRHSKYQGKFKWFAIELAREISPVLEEFRILTPKQIVRMGDVELIAELSLIIKSGLAHKSSKDINKIYNDFETDFPDENKYFNKIKSFFEILRDNFSELKNSMLMKPYAIHSFFTAYVHIRYGIPNGIEDIGFPPRKKQIKINENVLNQLLTVSDAHETKDTNGKYKDYVLAAISTTTKHAQRRARAKVLAKILDPGS